MPAIGVESPGDGDPDASRHTAKNREILGMTDFSAEADSRRERRIFAGIWLRGGVRAARETSRRKSSVGIKLALDHSLL